MYLTVHGKERMRERCGLKSYAAERLATRALAEGITHADATGPLKKWMDAEFLKHGNGNNMRVYGEWLYVFTDEILITILAVPHEFRKILNKLRAKKRGERG